MSTRLQADPSVRTHLTRSQSARLRRLLLEEQALQQARLVELQDPADLDPDLAHVLLVRCQETLEEIEDALALIERGTYGFCAGCRTEIPYERLEALPGARRCVSCQAGHDRALR
jgi:RNA polymerase-binding transcription factor DksA